MKILTYFLMSAALCVSNAWLQGQTYTNFIRQVQYPTGVQWDASVAAAGQQLSSLAIDPGGARFELWTVNSTGPVSYPLQSCYVGTYIPLATVKVRSEDTTSAIPRTRADQPFYVDVTVSGLLSGATDPEPSKSVKFLRHVQSYGEKGTAEGLDRAQALLQSQSFITTNGKQNLTFTINAIPGSNRAKVRGEERYSIFSIADYQAPESQIDSEYIQIWPVADGNIAGITTNQRIRYSMPQLTLTLNDLYPFSTTYLQAYKGAAQLGVVGNIVSGSAIVINDSEPKNKVLTLSDYASAFEEDGTWTLELVTKTPFGLDRLAYVTFTLDRTMKMNGAFTTIE